MPDKVIVTNSSALSKKYGAKGLKAVLEAISDLAAADKARGLSTQLVDISDAARMKKFRGAPVSESRQPAPMQGRGRRNFQVCQARLSRHPRRPGRRAASRVEQSNSGDKDKSVPSDLPYASDAPFTKKDAAAYAAVTRVVGRIPGVTGAKEPDFLVNQIKVAASFKSRKRGDYLPPFAISAEVWEKSTEESVQNIFGSNAIRNCPPTGTPGVAKMLSPLAHFINCHGAQVDPQFYGQHGNRYPVSMTSDDVEKGAKRNTIVAAECCFGAQLYDPTFADGKWPISNAYLRAGAVGFFGSTNRLMARQKATVPPTCSRNIS